MCNGHTNTVVVYGGAGVLGQVSGESGGGQISCIRCDISPHGSERRAGGQRRINEGAERPRQLILFLARAKPIISFGDG